MHPGTTHTHKIEIEAIFKWASKQLPSNHPKDISNALTPPKTPHIQLIITQANTKKALATAQQHSGNLPQHPSKTMATT